MTHTTKFLWVRGENSKAVYDAKELLNMDGGAIVKLEYGSDGKLLNSSVIKQNGVFEPTFTLRAGDMMAAPFVQMYYEMLKVTDVNQEKVVSAQACAKTFRDYEGPKKKAD